MSRVALTLLAFRAGELRVAIAAGAARAVLGPSPDGAPHLARLLGQAPGDDAGSRDIVLIGHGRETRVRVDGPVATRPLRAADVVPTAPGLPIGQRTLIAGFAHDADGLTLLLDVERVIDALTPPTPPRMP